MNTPMASEVSFSAFWRTVDVSLIFSELPQRQDVASFFRNFGLRVFHTSDISSFTAPPIPCGACRRTGRELICVQDHVRSTAGRKDSLGRLACLHRRGLHSSRRVFANASTMRFILSQTTRSKALRYFFARNIVDMVLLYQSTALTWRGC